MGMIINGQWEEIDRIHDKSRYQRPVSKYNNKYKIEDLISNSGRYYLIGSWSCPWSHRTLIYRHLLGLEKHIPLHMTGGKKIQGYSANHGDSWHIPGTLKEDHQSITHLHELYVFNDKHYTGRSTVPILWDSKTLSIISNESTDIIDLLIKATGQINPQQATLLDPPSAITHKAVLALNTKIYEQFSNGVYQAAFAKSQQAYDIAIRNVFELLDFLEEKLQHRRFLFGDQPSHSDWLLFPSLVRFDIEYYLHSGCCHKQLRDYPKLWLYARRLYHTGKIADTVNFEAIHASNYFNTPIKPLMPTQNWQQLDSTQ